MEREVWTNCRCELALTQHGITMLASEIVFSQGHKTICKKYDFKTICLAAFLKETKLLSSLHFLFLNPVCVSF